MVANTVFYTGKRALFLKPELFGAKMTMESKLEWTKTGRRQHGYRWRCSSKPEVTVLSVGEIGKVCLRSQPGSLLEQFSHRFRMF